MRLPRDLHAFNCIPNANDLTRFKTKDSLERQLLDETRILHTAPYTTIRSYNERSYNKIVQYDHTFDCVLQWQNLRSLVPVIPFALYKFVASSISQRIGYNHCRFESHARFCSLAFHRVFRPLCTVCTVHSLPLERAVFGGVRDLSTSIHWMCVFRTECSNDLRCL